MSSTRHRNQLCDQKESFGYYLIDYYIRYFYRGKIMEALPPINYKELVGLIMTDYLNT